MKITSEQSKYIIDYLINEGLEYKEFIDEMHDHFIDSIEAEMEEDLNFHQALSATSKGFENEIYRSKFLPFLPKKGLKAMEKKFYESKKQETNAELEENLMSTFFSIPNALVLCYVGLVFYLFQGGSMQRIYTGLIIFWMFPALFFSGYIRRKLKVSIDNAGGLGWLLASKKQRVRSVYVNLLLHIHGGGWLGWLTLLSVLLHFANKYGYLSNEISLYTMLFIIAVTLLAQVKAIKMIPRINRLINS